MAGFMELQVWQEDGIEVDLGFDAWGLLPLSLCFDRSTRGATESGLWWARYSAPGYLYTDPVYGKTALEALERCWHVYGDHESEDDVREYDETKRLLMEQSK